MEKGQIRSEWQERLLATRANGLCHNLPWETGKVRRSAGHIWINQQRHNPALSSWCAPALQCQGVPIPREWHSVKPISVHLGVSHWSDQGGVDRPWALSGGVPAWGGSRAEGAVRAVAVSQGAQIESIMMIYGRTVSLLFGSFLYGSTRSWWKVLLGAKGA